MNYYLYQLKDGSSADIPIRMTEQVCLSVAYVTYSGSTLFWVLGKALGVIWLRFLWFFLAYVDSSASTFIHPSFPVQITYVTFYLVWCLLIMFQILIVSSTIIGFWVVTLCNPVERYECFRDTWRQQVPLKNWHVTTRLHGFTSKKTIIIVSIWCTVVLS